MAKNPFTAAEMQILKRDLNERMERVLEQKRVEIEKKVNNEIRLTLLGMFLYGR